MSDEARVKLHDLLAAWEVVQRDRECREIVERIIGGRRDGDGGRGEAERDSARG